MSQVNHNDHEGVELCLSWQPASNGTVPAGAIDAGSSCYVARARHEGEWVPGKLPQGHSAAYVAYGGKEVPYEDYEILVASELGHFGCGFEWQPASAGSVPKRSLVCGYDSGEPLYAARATIDGEVCSGKAVASHGCAYFPHGGEEHKVEDYEVLVFN